MTLYGYEFQQDIPENIMENGIDYLPESSKNCEDVEKQKGKEYSYFVLLTEVCLDSIVK